MRTILALAALLAGCSAGAPAREGGIVSTNPCADQLLLALVPPSRIAAISRYSLDPAASSIPLPLAHRFRTTAGTAEEVIALRPSLVVASSFTPPAARAAFARAGLRTLYLDAPATVAASEAQVTSLAAEVGAAPRGRALVASIRSAMASRSAVGRQPSALLFLGGDLASGEGTLLDAMMQRAGLRDAAADYGLRHTGAIGAEAIAAHPPDIILLPDGDSRVAANRRRLLDAVHGHVTVAVFPRALANCGGPTIPAALNRLAAIRRSLGA